jgi:hypothetical protein
MGVVYNFFKFVNGNDILESMKKPLHRSQILYIVLILLIFVFAGAFVLCGRISVRKNDLSRGSLSSGVYRNENLGFEIKLLSGGWQVEVDPDGEPSGMPYIAPDVYDGDADYNVIFFNPSDSSSFAIPIRLTPRLSLEDALTDIDDHVNLSNLSYFEINGYKAARITYEKTSGCVAEQKNAHSLRADEGPVYPCPPEDVLYILQSPFLYELPIPSYTDPEKNIDTEIIPNILKTFTLLNYAKLESEKVTNN